MNISVPAREYVSRNVEQVLILETPFCPVGEKFLENHLYALKCVHVICSCAVVFCTIHVTVIRCLRCTML
jgi:hypothetical protein